MGSSRKATARRFLSIWWASQVLRNRLLTKVYVKSFFRESDNGGARCLTCGPTKTFGPLAKFAGSRLLRRNVRAEETVKPTIKITAALALLIASACTPRMPWPNSGVFTGYYFYGFEKSIFAPIGSSERWWVTGNIESVATLYRASSKNARPTYDKPIYLVVRGTLSSEGHYGHLSAYTRELIVTEVIEHKEQNEMKGQL